MSEKKELWVILAIVFWGFIGISMPYLIFPALFINPDFLILSPVSTGLTRSVFLGITLAAYPLGQFIGSPILGALSDDFGRKKVMSVSLIIAAISNLLSGLAIGYHILSLLILSRFVTGIMEGNIAVARAMAVELKTISKHVALGRVNAFISIAYLMGPFIGGLLSDRTIYHKFTPTTPFLFVSFLFFFLSALSLVVFKRSAIQSQMQPVSFAKRINFIKRMCNLFTNGKLKFLIIASTIFTLAVDIYYEFGPVYLTQKWTLGPADLVYYNGILCAGLAIGNGWLANYCSKRFLKLNSILFGISSFSILMICTIFSNTRLFMLTLFGLTGIGIGVAITTLTVKISDAADSRVQGEVMGVQVSLRVLGDGIICLLGGILLVFSSKLILGISALMSLASLAYFYFGSGRRC